MNGTAYLCMLSGEPSSESTIATGVGSVDFSMSTESVIRDLGPLWDAAHVMSVAHAGLHKQVRVWRANDLMNAIEGGLAGYESQHAYATMRVLRVMFDSFLRVHIGSEFYIALKVTLP